MQVYHQNARTNSHMRREIQSSGCCAKELAQRYSISAKTVDKWKSRDFTEDKSSRPHTVHYGLDEVGAALASSLRRASWDPHGAVAEMMREGGCMVSDSAVYRHFVREGLNTPPKALKEKARRFKEYDPGYIHIDITYLPEFNGQKHYLFVAIDRATRFMFYFVYAEKTAANAQDFLNKAVEAFPYQIDYILTDNGLEFTNRLIISKKGKACTKVSLFDETCVKEGIEHRHTKPYTPKTNGMVERVNGTIKKNTILSTRYKSVSEMVESLNRFLQYYNFRRRHGSLAKELKVQTPFQAMCKWYELKPEIFVAHPRDFFAKEAIFAAPLCRVVFE